MSDRSRLGLLALAVVVYLLMPYRWATGLRARDDAAARRANATVRAFAPRIAHARAVASNPGDWAAQVAQVRAAFPSTIDVRGELTELRAVAASSGARLTSISADPPVEPAPTGVASSPAATHTGVPTIPAPTPDAIAIRLQVTGPLDGIESFLTRLRAAPRLVTIEQQAYTFASDTHAEITAELTGRVWFLPSPV